MALTLSGHRDMLSPALHEATRRGGPRVIDAGLQVSPVDEAIVLVVRHRLFARHELESGDFKRLFLPRVEEALLVKERGAAARAARVDRRRLQWRGANARNLKARPR